VTFSTAAARGSSKPLPLDPSGSAASIALPSARDGASPNTGATRSLTVLITVPTLETGAADVGALDLVRMLFSAGHRPIVVSSGGRLSPLSIRPGVNSFGSTPRARTRWSSLAIVWR
jgi:hypothetical protein